MPLNQNWTVFVPTNLVRNGARLGRWMHRHLGLGRQEQSNGGGHVIAIYLGNNLCHPKLVIQKLDNQRLTRERPLHLFSPSNYSSIFLGSGSCGRNLRKARISAASQIVVILNAERANDARSTDFGDVVLAIMSKKAPIRATFAK